MLTKEQQDLAIQGTCIVLGFLADSEHRQNLVERYFPNASHQVIILSTDTEVEQGYFEELRPRLARSRLARAARGRADQRR